MKQAIEGRPMTNIDENNPVREYIELNSFLKMKGIVPTGGQAKMMIRSEIVKVNGEIETRNKRKLHQKDIVEINNKRYIVEF